MTAAALAAEFADLEQQALAAADVKFHAIHGDEHDWSDPEWDQYEHLLARVHRVFRADYQAVA